MIFPVILSGGSGSRLWPLSRKKYPKQFLSLINETSLLQDTILRMPKGASSPLIVCNEDHRFIVAEQLRQINSNNNGIILEPIGKNTAPAIAIAAMTLLNQEEDPILLVVSADHTINDTKNFHKTINNAVKHAEQGNIVVIGVNANKPEVGYGYIEVDYSNKDESSKIISFKEKPNLELAKQYLESGNYYWNSGIFILKASIYLNELEKYEPEIFHACKKSSAFTNKDLDFIRLNNEEFLKCPDKSIDYAVMEKTSTGVIVPFHGHWNDIGSWETLWDSKAKDSNKNVCEGDVSLSSVYNSYIHSSSRLICVNNVSDLIIIDTDDALLVSTKKNSQNIKNIVHKLKSDNRCEIDNHRKVFRPWGYFDSVDYGSGFQVKRILVNPGAKISLQKHKYRSEHWIVVEGIATITCGDKVFKLKENQSTYIPKGEIHRLENKEKNLLKIIEIQTGSYLGEDDIIRLEDDYHRA